MIHDHRSHHHRVVKPPERPYQPFTQAQTYSIAGRAPGDSSRLATVITVLAGYAPPKITGGWPKINVIDRPLRTGFTVPAGYDPWSMDLPIQFEAVVTPGWQPTSIHVEQDIRVLEWMAGRNHLLVPSPGSSLRAANKQPLVNPVAEVLPIVDVVSLDDQGNETSLIPPNLHGIPWLVSNIDYDTTVGASSSGGQQSSGGVIRDRYGNRTRQAAVVSLIEYNAAPGAVNSPAARQARRGNTSGPPLVVHASQAYDTVEKLVLHEVAGDALYQDLRKVADFNHIRSIHQRLKIGRKILIPRSVMIVR